MAKSAPERTPPSTSLRDSFGQGNSPAFARAGGSPAALKALTTIERRHAAVRTRMIAHHKSFEDRWTAKEALRVWKAQLAQNARYPAPKGQERDVLPDAVFRMAQRNVQARNNRRLAALNAVRVRMSNAVIRNLDLPKPRQEFRIAASPEQQPNPTQTMRRTR